MKYCRGVGNVGIKDIPEPTPGPREVVIEVEAAGICGTDLHIYYDEFKTNPPVVMGHELSGFITQLGAEVSGWEVGDRVTAETYASTCMQCRYCLSGDFNLCLERKSIGSRVDGAFATYCAVRAENLHRLPESLSLTAAALSEPVACCVHGVTQRTVIRAGDVVVISGPGTIGLICMQLAKAAGGITVVCGTAKDTSRLQLARKLGVDYVVNVDEEDPWAVVGPLTNNFGADVVLETAGVGLSAQTCLEIVRRRGSYTQVGLFGKPITFDLDQAAYKELTITGSNASTKDSWRRGLELLGKGTVVTEPLISHQLPLSEWETGFQIFQEKQGGKILLVP